MLALSIATFASLSTSQTPTPTPVPVVGDVFEDLGQAVGSAEQVGFGSLYPGTTVALRLSDAPAGVPVQCVIGFTRVDSPVGSGTLVPAPDIVVPLMTDGVGSAEFITSIPSSYPFGQHFYAQWITQDLAQPSGIGLSNAFRCNPPPAPTDGSVLYDDVMAYINSPTGQAEMDQALITQIVADEINLRANPAQLLELITIFTTPETDAATPSTGTPSQTNGGNVSGPKRPFKNIFGGTIGSGQTTVTWATDSQGRRRITGHTAVGGVPLGSVSSSLIGTKWWKECPDGSLVQCGNYQVEGTQGWRWFLKNTVKQPVFVICAPCPVRS